MQQCYFSLRQLRLIKYSFFIHSTTSYIHPKLDSQIESNYSIVMRLLPKVSCADSNFEFPQSTLARCVYVINIVKLMIIFNWHSGLPIGPRNPYSCPGE